MSKLFLGIDVGGTKCGAVVGDLDGIIHHDVNWPSQAAEGPESMLAEIYRETQMLLSQHDVVSIGVSIGGPLDTRKGIIQGPPHLPGWNDIPLKSYLEARFQLPVHIEHDAAACALAEHRWGAAQGQENVVYLTCGTGFGGGLILNGKVHRPSNGFSCDLGHWKLREEGPLLYGKEGSAESYCSGTALQLLAAWKFPERWKDNPPKGAELNLLAQDGDSDAQWVIQTNAEATGDVCSLLGDLLSPDVILLGSLARYLGDGWVTQVQERFVSQVQPAIAEHVEIKPAGLGDRLQPLSALVPAVEAFLLSDTQK